jgi:hypothetical protein
MGASSVFTGAVYLFVFPLLSHRPPHPETDSVGAVPLLYIILVQYHACFRRKPLKRATGARNTTHKNTENTGLVGQKRPVEFALLTYVSQQDRAV